MKYVIDVILISNHSTKKGLMMQLPPPLDPTRAAHARLLGLTLTGQRTTPARRPNGASANAGVRTAT